MRKQKIAIPTVQCACANRKQQSLLRMCEQKTTFFTAHAQTENNYPYCATIPTAHAQTENNSLYCACINRKQLPYFACVNRKQQYGTYFACANRKQQSPLRMRKQKTKIPTVHAKTVNKDPHCACADSPAGREGWPAGHSEPAPAPPPPSPAARRGRSRSAAGSLPAPRARA